MIQDDGGWFDSLCLEVARRVLSDEESLDDLERRNLTPKLAETIQICIEAWIQVYVQEPKAEGNGNTPLI